MASRDGAPTFHPGTLLPGLGGSCQTAELPMAQAAAVLNVVSSPKHSVSLFLMSLLPWQRRSLGATLRI